MTRRDELSENLREVRERIAVACGAVGRSPEDVELLAVTKTFPASDVALLSDLGLVAFAENRDQEASAKVAEFAELRPGASACWHMVGNVQRNKARSVVSWADRMDTLDSTRLADALAKAVGGRGGPLEVLIQVSVDGDPARGGCPVDDVAALAEHVARSGELDLRGVMAVAPLEMNPLEAFSVLQAVVSRLRRDHPAATVVSAGMSGDLEDAIARGSTCVRVGTALLGGRTLASP
ncbi:YggS family pyridoxal phosphate-dependent enzyme [Umezawaea sp. Da 62-37]|uniref:YggS family pyridoxal phosphate-dependent enzyme n=1 Tax=Umezawaea sp. Da 62-37 TaxID=3075927 RepID=UPI0028F74730|nr:YggS family pyridoxal phosphate-dependent enzyme [Umezawaea sp. Da 62-37]WNV89718.1 YggS family pyridoxal phosphate-dependent enzyme [Umezawaea sp. Da 62-37]